MEANSVKDCYGGMALREWRRLVKDPFHRLEFDTTLHFLKKHLPKKGLILDAGGGPGRYTIELAKMGYEVVLLDLTPELLKTAERQIARAKVKQQVKAVVEGSITDLSQFKNNSFDAVLCLGGPLSHVKTKKSRQRAVSELVRVAKKDAPVFISVMGRLAVLTGCARYWPDEINLTKHFREIWQDGDDYLWRGGTSYCHFFMSKELKELVTNSGVEILECVGLEGLGSNTRREINKLARGLPKAWRNWLEAHHELCTHPAVFATSGHMLVVGRKI